MGSTSDLESVRQSHHSPPAPATPGASSTTSPGRRWPSSLDRHGPLTACRISARDLAPMAEAAGDRGVGRHELEHPAHAPASGSGSELDGYRAPRLVHALPSAGSSAPAA